MRRWKFCSILTIALALGALGCGSSSPTTVTLTIAPTTVSVVTNLTQQFSAFVTGSSNMTVTWTIACATGVTATGACGTINAAGLYTAPATIPTVTTNGTTTTAPTATITATSAADTYEDGHRHTHHRHRYQRQHYAHCGNRRYRAKTLHFWRPKAIRGATPLPIRLASM